MSAFLLLFAENIFSCNFGVDFFHLYMRGKIE